MKGHTRERQPIGPAAVAHTPTGAPLHDRSTHRTDPDDVAADNHAATSLADAWVRADLAALADALDAAEMDQ